MGKREVDQVLRQLVRAVNESGQAVVPVAVSPWSWPAARFPWSATVPEAGQSL
jgi:hypothetical protein